MKTLYLDCGMGAAGDMLAASLYELLPKEARNPFLKTMNALLPGVAVRAEHTEKCGVGGTHLAVTVNGVSEISESTHVHEHAHEHKDAHAHEHEDTHAHNGHSHGHGRNFPEIERLMSGLPLPESVRENALAVYRLLAAAESEAHGKPVDQIHFHEVGDLDAIADISAVCLLLHTLAPDRVVASPVHVGSGKVRCAHGILPVPAPATAILLKGVPIYGGTIQGELCTPTGAALLKHFCTFGNMPAMTVSGIGYGMGTKEFEAANCVRAMLGEADSAPEIVAELRCNLDDMTPEAIGFALDRLWDGPVLDVFTSPVGMKKNRPGTLLTCLCRSENVDQIVKLLFRHTSTLGIRKSEYERYTLERTVQTVSTDLGPMRIKKAYGFGAGKEKVEFEDASRAALEYDIPLSEATEAIVRASHAERSE